jgi:hypothetical protein
MERATMGKVLLATIGLLGLAVVAGTAQEPGTVLDANGSGQQNAPDASRIIFGSNLISDPCATCNYSDGGGYAVAGPDNCINPGVTQWLAGAFIASASGVAERISAAIILRDSQNCPENKVTLSIYSDACYPNGPGTLLGSGTAAVPQAPCDLAVAKLKNPVTLTKDTKYWVTATTGSSQSGLDSNWYGSNNSQYAFNTGTGWQHFTGGTPAFMVQGSGTVFSQMIADASHAAFGGNLLVDPCTGCNYDPNAPSFPLSGPENCTSPGTATWLAVPFVAAKSGVPKRITAPIILRNPVDCPENKVTLSLYTDDCDLGPGTLLVSGIAIAPTAPCEVAVAKLSNSPMIVKGQKYWITATTSTDQAALDAHWYGSNAAQDAFNPGFGPWIQSNAATPAFLVQ